MVLPSLAEHVDVLLYLLLTLTTAFFAAIAWFITNTLQRIDANQEKLFGAVGELTMALAKLQGEHELLVRNVDRIMNREG